MSPSRIRARGYIERDRSELVLFVQARFILQSYFLLCVFSMQKKVRTLHPLLPCFSFVSGVSPFLVIDLELSLVVFCFVFVFLCFSFWWISYKEGRKGVRPLGLELLIFRVWMDRDRGFCLGGYRFLVCGHWWHL